MSPWAFRNTACILPELFCESSRCGFCRLIIKGPGNIASLFKKILSIKMVTLVVPDFNSLLRPTSKYPQIKQDCDNPRTGDKAEAPLDHGDWKALLGRVRGTATCGPHHPSTRLAQCQNKRGPWAYGFSGGKRKPEVNIQFPQPCWTLPQRPTWVLSHSDHWGSLWVWTTGEGGRGLQQSAVRTWWTTLLTAAVYKQNSSQQLYPSAWLKVAPSG